MFSRLTLVNIKVLIIDIIGSNCMGRKCIGSKCVEGKCVGSKCVGRLIIINKHYKTNIGAYVFHPKICEVWWEVMMWAWSAGRYLRNRGLWSVCEAMMWAWSAWRYLWSRGCLTLGKKWIIKSTKFIKRNILKLLKQGVRLIFLIPARLGFRDLWLWSC